ncbi:rho GTPase-activating protein 27-like isoform X2 [Pristis pectinata]|uniref:rho GTPase-activating protein 27-like isoform X2 n=1 Tax=Pristis pectinata TaxID=685728 RepID=UPI00223D186E|nr:rho GTPase-activating protein 27-like isoform X2 [Pristis pectinata]
MSTATGEVLVQVEYNYQYTARDGRLISIKQNEKYILLSRTNDHWWHVKKDDQSKPFYLPAHYVRELTSERAVSPGVPSLVGPDATENQNSREISKTQSVFKNHCNVGKDQLFHQDEQGHNDNNSDPILEKENQPNLNPTKPKDPSLNQLANDSPPTLRGSNPSQHSSVPPNLTACYSEVAKAFERNKESNSKRFTTTNAPKRLSSTVRVRAKQQDNFAHRLSLIEKLQPALPIFNPEGLDHYLGLNKAKEISLSEKVYPLQRTSFSQGANSKRYSAVEIGAVILGHPKLMETKKSSLPEEQFSDSENTYESIPDLPKPKTKSRKEEHHDTPKVFNKKSEAVYQNVAQLKQELAEEQSVPSTGLTNQQEEWETHTDQASGQPFYYNPVTGETTWDCPFDTPDSREQQAPPSRSSSISIPSAEWESHFDEVSGQPYYYNPATGETTWELPGQEAETMEREDTLRDQRPPTPEKDYPEFIEESPPAYQGHRRQPSNWSQEEYSEPQSPVDTPIYQSVDPTPPGWSLGLDQEGQMLYTSEVTQEKWIRHVDSNGKFYYYNPDEDKSEWELPQYEAPSSRHNAGNGIDQEGNVVFSNWRHSQSLKNLPPLRSDIEEKSQSLDKAGILNKAKVADNGKRIRKNWASSWTVLQGGILTFYKDPKNQSAGSLKQAIGQIVPEYTVELKGATIGWAGKDKSSKKNVLELKTRRGSEYLIQYDTESVIGDWYKTINESIIQMLDPVSTDEVDSAYDIAVPERINNKEKDEKRNRSVSKNPVVNAAETADTKKVKTKLKKFLQRRPTLQTVREKGYIQDQVFGSNLVDLCRREGTTVPHFVLKCIQAVENRGLDIDGLYRVSGNLAVIQKLRFKINHDENVNLEESPWDDVHVITGALKLFFRELSEPLFPFNYFDNFIAAIKLGDPAQRLNYMKDLISSLPAPNHDTMQVLFRHLCSVIDCRNQNRMSSQSMAIVFGPTLLKPEVETGNITIHMVYQNQIVEYVLNQYQHLFNESQDIR